MYYRFLCCAFIVVALAACDKVDVVENPGEFSPSIPGRNQAPKVNAGEDVTIRWPVDEVQLQGSATDDGLPADGKLLYLWRSADARVSFGAGTDPNTTARFAEPGQYTLTLTVSDGPSQTSDSLLVIVQAELNNQPPVVDAGEDFTAELPFPARLRGAVTDDGFAGAELQVQWSGPDEVMFESPDQLETRVTFQQPGLYELVLTASDGEQQSSDSIEVLVNPAVYPAPDLSEEDPDRGWLRVAPEQVGMDGALLRQAEQYSMQAGGAGMIVRKGRLVHSWGDIDHRSDIKSTTASIASITLALAMDEARVALDDLAATHLPTFGTPPSTNDPTWLSQVSLVQLATHTAGFEKTGGYGALLAPPGTQWRYSDGGLNWLADVLTTVHMQDLQTLLAVRVWPVLGINERDDIRWRDPATGFRREPRANGIVHREFASGMIGNTNTMARVGLLFLRRGEWADGVRVFSPEFVDLVRAPAAAAASASVVEPAAFPEANRRFGVLWWTNATAALANVPTDAYWAWGLSDSLIVVIPSLDLVIARTGLIQPASPDERILGDNDWTGEYDVLAPFLDPIVRAVSDDALFD